MSTSQYTVRLPVDVGKKVELMADENNLTVNKQLANIVSTYIDAWMQDKALFANRSITGPINMNGFLLLTLIRSLVDSDEQYRLLLNHTLDAIRDNGTLEGYISRFIAK